MRSATRRQHGVPRGVAERVVDVGEAVEFGDDQAASGAGVDRILDGLLQHVAVGEAGQRVVVGKAIEHLVLTLGRRHILDNDAEPSGAPSNQRRKWISAGKLSPPTHCRDLAFGRARPFAVNQVLDAGSPLRSQSPGVDERR